MKISPGITVDQNGEFFDSGKLKWVDRKIVFQSNEGYIVRVQGFEDTVKLTFHIDCRIHARTDEEGSIHLLALNVE